MSPISGFVDVLAPATVQSGVEQSHLVLGSPIPPFQGNAQTATESGWPSSAWCLAIWRCSAADDPVGSAVAPLALEQTRIHVS